MVRMRTSRNAFYDVRNLKDEIDKLYFTYLSAPSFKERDTNALSPAFQ